MPITRADVVTEARAFHEAIIRADDEALRELAQSWVKVRDDLIRQEREFLSRLVKRNGMPLKLTPNQLYRVERMDLLIAQVQDQIDGWAQDARGMVTDSRRRAFTLAMEHADAYAKLSGFEGMRQATPVTDPAVLQSAVARTRTSAVDGIFANLGTETANRCKDLIITGVGAAKHPFVVARELVRATDMPAWRAANISRTEMMHAYRDGSLQAWQKSSVVQEWVWLTAEDHRVCPVCRAMQGTVHPVSEPFATHPSCRCIPTPQTRSWGDLLGSDFADIPESVPRIPDGESAFSALSTAEQKRVLGPGRYDLYESGTPLRSMVRTTSDPVWGPGRELIPLYEM